MSTATSSFRMMTRRPMLHKRAWAFATLGLLGVTGALAYQADDLNLGDLLASSEVEIPSIRASSQSSTHGANVFSSEASASLMSRFQPAPGEHPIQPLIRWAESRIDELRAVEDYDCVFHKQEIVDGELQTRETIYMRVRHEPFSVYLRFLAPSRGKEVLFVENQNGGKLRAHLAGMRRVIGTRSLSPTSHLAMRGNRYPITEIGLLNLTERMIQAGKAELASPNCVVKLRPDTAAGKPCLCVEVIHPTREPQQKFQRALIYIDEQYNLPIRYVAYGWLTDTTASPEPYEDYMYSDLHFNCGLDDMCFHAGNPDYDFR